MCVAFLVCKRVRWREPAVTNLTTHSDVYVVQGHKRIEAEYVSSQKLEEKRINKTPDRKKGNKKAATGCETVERAQRTRKRQET